MNLIFIFLFFISINFNLINSNQIRKRRQANLEPSLNGSIPFGIAQFNRVGVIPIGTPPKNFTLALNLQSSAFWVVDNNADFPWTKTKYNNNTSKFSIPTGRNVTYTDGKSGPMFMDNITIGDLRLPVMRFVSIISYPKMPTEFQFTPLEGVFGLAPPLKMIDPCKASPLVSIMSVVDHPIVTITQYSVTVGDSNIGKLTFGAENYDDCVDEYDYVPLAEEGQWSVKILSVKVDDAKLNVTLSPMLKIMDQALYMYGPKAQLDELAKMLGAEVPDDVGDFYLLNQTACDNMDQMPKITIRFGEEGKDTSKTVLKPEHYMEVSPIGECRLLFMTNEVMQYDNDYWVMGQQFLVNRCVSVHFRKGRMGFAQGREIDETDNQTEISEDDQNTDLNDVVNKFEDVRIKQFIGM
uniref:Peptidase A1 domain-containing protein n=1 Tax=Meloidogyne enterolobii TaxID=390850 RepID=A0A6V7U207_MELEN|nr:unnamed protein product [Meloidogyne enterolobii]